MNPELTQNAWNNFKTIKLINNIVSRKTIDIDIKLITNEARRNYLVSEPNYLTVKKCSGNLLAIEMKRTQILFRSINIRIK